MPVTAVELLGPKEFEYGNFAELQYHVEGTQLYDEAAAAVLLAAPSSFNSLAGFSLARMTIALEPRGLTSWLARVPYAKREAGATSIIDFDTTGGQTHITSSYETFRREPAMGLNRAPDFSQAIGVTDDNIEGVDIVSPRLGFAETHVKTDGTVTWQYVNTLVWLTGKVNNEAGFRNFFKYEVLFLGARGSRDPVSGLWTITYAFEVSRHQLEELNFGNGVVLYPQFVAGIPEPVSKLGWHYLWVRYSDEVDADTKRLVKIPIGVYVEAVYLQANFADLQIGVGGD